MHNAIRQSPSSRYSWPSNDHASPDLHDNSVTNQRPPHPPLIMQPMPATLPLTCRIGTSRIPGRYVQNFHAVQMRPTRPKRSRGQERTDTTCILPCCSAHMLRHESVQLSHEHVRSALANLEAAHGSRDLAITERHTFHIQRIGLVIG